ncbi:hypothetical protein KM043_002961 [Ampulex compressa]|nr:hypothetical protein KM043_002961 [Ampulex compressa]
MAKHRWEGKQGRAMFDVEARKIKIEEVAILLADGESRAEGSHAYRSFIDLSTLSRARIAWPAGRLTLRARTLLFHDYTALQLNPSGGDTRAPRIAGLVDPSEYLGWPLEECSKGEPLNFRIDRPSIARYRTLAPNFETRNKAPTLKRRIPGRRPLEEPNFLSDPRSFERRKNHDEE